MCGRTRTEGTIRRIGVIALLAATAMLIAAVPASATPLNYSFTSNNQGWQQSQDNGFHFAPAGFASSGGNPGGRLTAKDDPNTGAETGCPNSDPCNLLTFYSPFVEKLGANYGGTAFFDLRSNASMDFPAELFLLAEGSDYLDGVVPTAQGTGWHTLSIHLDETAAWSVCPYAGGDCTRPSQRQFQNLIGNSDEVAVMVDVGPNGTGETYDLDNVVLTNGGPHPPTPPVPPPPAKPKKKCKKRHRAGSAKKHKCKKKPRAAASLRG